MVRGNTRKILQLCISTNYIFAGTIFILLALSSVANGEDGIINEAKRLILQRNVFKIVPIHHKIVTSSFQQLSEEANILDITIRNLTRIPRDLSTELMEERLGSEDSSKTSQQRIPRSKSKKKSNRVQNQELNGSSRSLDSERVVDQIITKSRLLCPTLSTADSKLTFSCSLGRSLKSRCIMRCLPGYRLRGDKRSRKCRYRKDQRNQKKGAAIFKAFWSGRDEEFQCVSTCRDLAPPRYGNVLCNSSDVVVSGSITFRSCKMICDPGYAPVNADTRYCQVNGSWSGERVTCRPSRPRVKKHLFNRFQTLKCGHVQSLTTYRLHGTLYLAAADKVKNLIRIYQWARALDSFFRIPWQIIRNVKPLQIEALPRKDGDVWLVAGNENNTTIYKLDKLERFFSSSHSQKFILTSGNSSNGIDIRPLKGRIYRCKATNKRKRAVIVVHKLEDRKEKREVFRRVMRRRMKLGEKAFQCSLFLESNRLRTVVSLNKQNGRGKIVIGAPNNGKMRIKDTLVDRDLRHLSDVREFKSDEGDQYIVAGQAVRDGKCFIYKRTKVDIDEITGS